MKNLIHILFSSLFSLSLLGCGNANKEDVSMNETIEPASSLIQISKEKFADLKMQLGRISEQKIKSTVSARGFIEVPPDFRASVSPLYSGFVKDILVLPGEEVKRGQVLYSLQNPEYIKTQQAYLEAKEELAYFENDYQRQKTLAGENIASAKGLAKAESDFKVMAAKCLGLKEQLKLMNISINNLEKGNLTNAINVYAPISGRVTQVNLSKGSYVSPEESTMGIVNLKHVHLELDLFEKDAFLVREGQSITFELADAASGLFSGKVHLVGTEIDATKRTINVHGHIDLEGDFNFIPGMYVDAQIAIREEVLPCLPAEAVVKGEAGDQILIKVREDQSSYFFEPLKISTGKKREAWIEVMLTDSTANPEVLTKGAFQVL